MTSSEPYLLSVSLLLALLPLSGLLFAFYSTYGKWRDSPIRNLLYPPGPPPTSILSGNLSNIPRTRPWETYTNWGKIYGDIMHFRVYGQHTILLNSVDDAVELLGKRSGLYSDRPKSVFVDLMGWDFNTGLISYGDKWRYDRQLFQQLFRPKASLAYRPVQTQKVHKFLHALLKRPEEFGAHCRTVASAIIVATMYGHDILSTTDDYYVTLAAQAVQKLTENLLPGAVVDALPILQYIPAWFPGASFKRTAMEVNDLTQQMQEVPLDFVKQGIVKGTARPSVVADLLENCYFQREYDRIKRVAATSYAAGADTTVSSVSTIFVAMTLFPEAQRKAQEEIDRVIGTKRLPTYDDRASLPYAEAFFREVMRWRPTMPLNIAHTTISDDIYKGYFIPKGANVVANIWAMSRNEDKYPKPDDFIPDRFFDEDGRLNNDDTVLTFGFGRRMCPGRHMASATVWLLMVSVLAAFNVRKKKDSRGNDMATDVQYTDSLVSHPLPFECSITARSATAKRLIEEASLIIA